MKAIWCLVSKIGTDIKGRTSRNAYNLTHINSIEKCLFKNNQQGAKNFERVKPYRIQGLHADLQGFSNCKIIITSFILLLDFI